MPSGIYKRTDEARKNMSLARIGKKFPNRKPPPPFTEEHKNKIRRSLIPFKKGHKHSPESIEKIRQSKIGKPSPRKGVRLSESTKKLMSEIKKELFKDISKHPQWKGGKSRGKHMGKEYVEWRNKVFKRDNWTCQECKLRGIYLEAHHIKSWAKYPKLRFELNNGLTLCKQCHQLTDNYKNKKCS